MRVVRARAQPHLSFVPNEYTTSTAGGNAKNARVRERVRPSRGSRRPDDTGAVATGSIVRVPGKSAHAGTAGAIGLAPGSGSSDRTERPTEHPPGLGRVAVAVNPVVLAA